MIRRPRLKCSLPGKWSGEKAKAPVKAGRHLGWPVPGGETDLPGNLLCSGPSKTKVIHCNILKKWTTPAAHFKGLVRL